MSWSSGQAIYTVQYSAPRPSGSMLIIRLLPRPARAVGAVNFFYAGILAKTVAPGASRLRADAESGTERGRQNVGACSKTPAWILGQVGRPPAANGPPIWDIAHWLSFTLWDDSREIGRRRQRAGRGGVPVAKACRGRTWPSCARMAHYGSHRLNDIHPR